MAVAIAASAASLPGLMGALLFYTNCKLFFANDKCYNTIWLADAMALIIIVLLPVSCVLLFVYYFDILFDTIFESPFHLYLQKVTIFVRLQKYFPEENVRQ